MSARGRGRGRSGPGLVVVVIVAALVLAVAAVVATLVRSEGTEAAEPVTVVEGAAFPSAIAPLPDGGFRYTELRSGAIREVGPGGEVRPDPVATVEVMAEPGQRGLLGLAVDGRDRTFAAWTRARDGRIVVAQVAPGSQRLVWEGPESQNLANGGRLAFARDGSLLIGVGDLTQPDLVDDPDAVNGKILALDPEGNATQEPRVLSGGWNNPFAFAVTADGAVWVADNAPGAEPERIGRGDRAEAPETEIEEKYVPTALVPLGEGELGMCSLEQPGLYQVGIDGDEATFTGERTSTGCTVAAARLVDGSIVVATQDRLAAVPG